MGGTGGRCNMSTLAATPTQAQDTAATEVPLGQIETELNRQFKAAQADAQVPVQRVRMSNLIIYCSRADQICQAESLVPKIVANHPARVLLLLADTADSTAEMRASVRVHQVDHDPRLVSEQVTLRAGNA